MECQFCSNTYDRSKRQPLVVSPCSHTFCLSCLENPDIKSCKTCSSVIKEKNTNWALLELIPASEYDTLKLKVENHLKESKLNEIKSKLKSTFPNETELNSMTDELSQIQSDMNQYKNFDEYNLVLNNKILNEANLIGALEIQDSK